jgi:cobalt/nickel transport system permease protein
MDKKKHNHKHSHQERIHWHEHWHGKIKHVHPHYHPSFEHIHPHNHKIKESLIHEHEHGEEISSSCSCTPISKIGHFHSHSYSFEQFAYLISPIHSLDARVKIITFFSLITAAVLTSPSNLARFAAFIAMLGYLYLISGVPLKYALLRSTVIFPFVILVALFAPFLPSSTISSYNFGFLSLNKNGLIVLWNVAIKSWISVLTIILLHSTTPFPKLLKAFRQLKVPTIFVSLLTFLYRFMWLLSEEAKRMKRAKDARTGQASVKKERGLARIKSGFNHWLWQLQITGNMIGSLFIRTYERAERVYAAMLARGYTGTIPLPEEIKFDLRDVLFLILFSVIFTTTILLTSLK